MDTQLVVNSFFLSVEQVLQVLRQVFLVKVSLGKTLLKLFGSDVLVTFLGGENSAKVHCQLVALLGRDIFTVLDHNFNFFADCELTQGLF